MSEIEQKALARAYKYLSYRDRSKRELYKYLEKKGFSSQVQESVVLYLEEQGYCDDLRFAKSFLDSRLRSNPKGFVAIAWELKQKGIDNSTIEAIKEMYPQELELELANKLLNKKYRDKKIYNKISNKDISSMGRYLYNRGFNPRVISKVVDEFIKT
ncbi:regulatory protein [Desulfitispora alkaliphila]|uniref:regulatory protein RecX n=1 Tax=Desulfitispora alkaliphila TaxID=622674 RepID=UPI003D1A2BFC